MAIKIRPFIFYFAVVCCIALLGLGVYCLATVGCEVYCLAMVCCIALVIIFLAIGSSDVSSDIQREWQSILPTLRNLFHKNNKLGSQNSDGDSTYIDSKGNLAFGKPTLEELRAIEERRAIADAEKRKRREGEQHAQGSGHSTLPVHQQSQDAGKQNKNNRGKTQDLGQKPQARQDQSKKWSGRTKTSALEDPLIALYNRAAENPSERQVFKERYNPIRFGTQNAMLRREDFSIAPEFQTANDGDYFAVKLHDSAPNLYAVMPRFDLLFQESSSGPGAMGIVFECRNYDSQFRYRRVKVIQAAIFESRDKQNWDLKEIGELELGQGEP